MALDEVKAALLKAEGNETASGSGGEVIHDPSTSADGGDETQPTIVLTVHHRNTPPDPPPPPPSPGLLAATNDLDFIDSDDPDADEGTVEAISPEIEYSDQWFDAQGTLTRSKNNLDDTTGDYDEARMSHFYDAQGTQYNDDSGDEVELESNTYDPIDVTNSGVPVEEKGSVRAREWVKSFDEDAESRVQRWMKMQKNRNPSSLPKSKSEIRLDVVGDPAETEKWANRDEIKLNTAGKKVNTNSSKDHEKKAKVKEKIQQRDAEKEKVARRESLKKIFQVRGKLSIKPIVDSLRPKYTDTDIYIASTPIALATNSADLRPSGNMDSLDVSEDGINCSSLDLDPGLDIKPGQEDEAKDEGQQRLPSTPLETQKGVKVKSEVRDGENQMSNGPDVVADSGCEVKRERIAPEQVKVEETGHDVSVADYVNLPITAVNNSEYKAISSDKAPAVTQSKLTDQNDQQEPKIIKSEMMSKEKNAEEIIESTASLTTEVQVTGQPTQPSSETKTETTKISVEDHATLAQKGDGEQPPDPSKSETKKKKIPVANIQKSIKNFAGSIFSQPTNGKAKKEGGGEDKKRWSRISPFTKDHIFKSSGKLKAEGDTAETKSNEGETQEPSTNESDHTVIGADKKTDITDVAADVPDADTSTNDTKGLNGISDEVSNGEVTEPLPDVLNSAGGSKNKTSMRVSPERLALIPTESDEPKSISHESSPGMDTSFVEEDGLRLRKDALKAIQAMDNDETATHFYSFLSASEYQTPVNKVTQDSNSVPEQVYQPTKSSTAEASREPSEKSESTNNSETEKSVKAKDHVSTAPDVTREITPMSDQSKMPEKELQSEISINDNNNSETQNLQTSSVMSTVSQETSAKSECDITSPSVTTSPDASQSSAVPPEVPKLKLTPALPVEGEDPPKPSPRLKKGRYGYSVNGTKRTPTSPPAPVSVSTKPEKSTAKPEDTVINGNASSNRTLNNSELATFPRRTQSKKRAPLVEHERISSDSGYVGPHSSSSNYYGGNDNTNSDNEPIYWEISETKDAPPRPSPRIKKGQPTSNDLSLEQTSPPRNGGTTSTLDLNYEGKQVPEWINNRAPIPSPRSRKQRSLQSLPTVAPSDESLETVKRKLQLQSKTSPEGATLQEPEGVQAEEDDQFYSGKAASISYGFTPNSQSTTSKPSVPPSPPLRGRKASQLSLPGAMMAEEMLNKKKNRRSVHEEKPDVNTRSNKLTQRPQYTNRARRRTDPTHGMSVRAIKSAMLVSFL